MKRAELAARNELQTLVSRFSKGNWQEAFGSSGTARALAEIMQLNGFGDGRITADGLDQLRAAMIKAGDIGSLDLKGIKSDRRPVIAGGLAIMSAVLSELGIESMGVAGGAMRQGILYDLLGRTQHHDMRDVTVSQFMQRYHVDSRQARRVAALAVELFALFTAGRRKPPTTPRRSIWSGRPSCTKSASRSPTAAITAIPPTSCRTPTCRDFRKWNRSRVATLVLAHRRTLRKVFTQDAEAIDWRMVMALRLAALILRSRADIARPLIAAAPATARCASTSTANGWPAIR